MAWIGCPAKAGDDLEGTHGGREVDTVGLRSSEGVRSAPHISLLMLR